MENREDILKEFMNEVIMKVFDFNKDLSVCYKYNLKNYPNYFDRKEIEECNQKIELLEYSLLKFDKIICNENIDILEYFLLD